LSLNFIDLVTRIVNLLAPENKITLKENICFQQKFLFCCSGAGTFLNKEGAENINYKFRFAPKLPSICNNQ